MSVKRYLRYETTIDLERKSINEVELPAFTVCPQFQGAYKSDILSKYGSDPDTMRELIFPSNVTNMKTIDFFEMVTFTIDEIVEQIIIKGVEVDSIFGDFYPFTS